MPLKSIIVIFILFVLVFFKFELKAQSPIDNRVTLKLLSDSCKIVVPHKYFLQSSFYISTKSGVKLDRKQFYINENVITLNDSICKLYSDSFFVSYRKLDFDLGKKYTLLDTTQLRKRDIAIYIGYDLTPDALSNANKIIDSKTLDYNGSFSRGFSVGNAQSLVVNSKFDMQLQGDIGNGISINAAISDDQIPIQAEGNTQVLQEFDRIFIEVKKDATSVIAGDYVAQKPNSYFVNYLKKVKGLGMRNSAFAKSTKINSYGNVATSRGKFARQFIVNKEGNQGPYKLSGNNNERYIIILSGTEKIYFNGELLRRGQDYDYVIDYNLSEITFTPNRLVARETRIIAEYEYTDQNYYRTLYTAGTEITWKKSAFNFNFYSEQDSKKTIGQINLDSSSIALLKEVGDDSEKYGITSIRQSATDDITSIKYELILNPNFPAEKTEHILVFSNDKDKLLYTSFFSETAFGKGSYSIDPTQSLNGRVYKYVGENKGNYDPINKLVPPEQKQMMDIGYSIQYGNNGRAYTNISLTNFDKNRFSTSGDNDNIGLGGFLSIEQKKRLSYISKDSLLHADSLQLYYGFSIENVGSQFKPLNQYRSAEFIRDWNYVATRPNNERISKAKFGIENSTSKIYALLNNFRAGQEFDGNNIGLDIDYKHKNFNFIALPSFTFSKAQNLASSFLRPNFKLSQKVPSLINTVFGIELEAEKNQKNNTILSKLDSTSYGFYYTKAYIGLGESEAYGLRLSYNKRSDYFAKVNVLQKAINIDEIELNGKWLSVESNTINASLKVRNYKVLDEVLAKNEKSKLTLLGSIDHGLSLLKKSFITNTNYIVNSGQEPKLEYIFQKIENLRGDFVYVGPDTATVKNINDFRYDPSNPLAQYVKFIVPNNEFTTTNNIALNHSLRIEPSRYFQNDTSKLNTFQNLISKITNSTIARISNKSASSSSEFNYFNFAAADSSLVSYTKNIVSTTMFNRGNSKYDASYIYKNNGNKNNQINGFETRSILENEFKTRITFLRNTDLFLGYISGNRQFENKLYTNRNFIIKTNKINAEISFRPNTKMRINGKYANIKNVQTINQKELATKNEYTLTYNLRAKNTSAFDLSFSFVDVVYVGSKGSLIQYDLLESLQPGSNYLWSLNFTRRISKFIDLTFTYEGRKTGTSDIINVGRMQAKASF